MKKLIAAFAGLLVLALLAAYLLLPAVQQPQLQVQLKANQKALLRQLIAQSLKQQKNGDSTQVVLRPAMFEGMVLSVPIEGSMHNSMLQLTAMDTGTTSATWHGIVKGGSAPWARWQTRQKAEKLKNTVRLFLEDLKQWENEKTLYGLNIRREKVKDTTLMAMRFETASYPGTKDIYSRIEQLQQYIQQHGATATNHPMLHVRNRPQSFEVMVALPANLDLPQTSSIEQKRMVMGNILMAEIKGGDATVRNGMRQLEDYVTDHGLVSPAIPYVSLVTDRRLQPDSSQWISRLFYPIF